MQRFLPWIERKSSRSAFTLIELLVVIAIIAILAVVVVLTLNPAELLRQSRDANRVSDMSTLNDAISLYQTDQSSASGYSLGTTSSTYISLPDSSSTCGTWGFTSGYACASSTSSRNVNGSGWIPINFSLITSGSPLGSLPVDPTNQSSSGLYYSYTTNGSQYQLISLMESTKYKQSVTGPLGNGITVEGSNEGSSPVGWWPLNEGTGTVAYDISGNGNNGTWAGTATGTAGYYSPGLVNTWAGTFDGSSDYVNVGKSLGGFISGTFSFWFYPNSLSQSYAPFINDRQAGGEVSDIETSGHQINFFMWNGATQYEVTYDAGEPLNTAWYYVVGTWNNTSMELYINGKYITSTNYSGGLVSTQNTLIGKDTDFARYFSGLISDVRIYNRALSQAEIEAIYNAKN